MKIFLVLFVMVLATINTYAISTESFINYLHNNNIKAFEKNTANRKSLNYSMLLVDYLENAETLKVETVEYLIYTKNANLNYLVNDMYSASEIFTEERVVPRRALIRLFKEGHKEIVGILLDRAEKLEVEPNFFYGSYRHIVFGSNGLLGAALSEEFLAPVEDIKYIWQRTKEHNKKDLFQAYHYEIVIALLDDVERLKYFINRDANLSLIWKAVIDFNAIKCAKYLTWYEYSSPIPYENNQISIKAYARKIGNKKMIKIVK